jgi:hypothetical protein
MRKRTKTDTLRALAILELVNQIHPLGSLSSIISSRTDPQKRVSHYAYVQPGRQTLDLLTAGCLRVVPLESWGSSAEKVGASA